MPRKEECLRREKDDRPRGGKEEEGMGESPREGRAKNGGRGGGGGEGDTGCNGCRRKQVKTCPRRASGNDATCRLSHMSSGNS